jgi:plastocyanin/mono/diheme cytochrome c family protein
VVIIGLVALATVLTVYIAREPERRASEAEEQEDVSIVRGTELYITYCLQCHGPAGLGSSAEEENVRLGPPLNTEFYQSDDPVEQEAAEDLIYHRLFNGAPSDPRAEKIMPSFAQDLNEEQMSDLVTLVMSGNWNYVYNTSVSETGETVAQAECDENEGEGEYCGNIEAAPPVYPTAPPPEEAEEDADAGEDAGEDVEAGDTDEAAGDGITQLEADDPYEWSESELTLAPGDTIEVTNVGFSQHNFAVDELGIEEDLPNGEPITITIPEDAEPGDYEFICSIPGHAEGGMVGTLTIEAP